MDLLLETFVQLLLVAVSDLDKAVTVLIGSEVGRKGQLTFETRTAGVAIVWVDYFMLAVLETCLATNGPLPSALQGAHYPL